MKQILGILACSALALAVRAEAPLLSLDFNSEAIGAQSGQLPEAKADGVVFMGGKPGVAKFGAAGSFQIPEFTPPTGAFTMESSFRLHDYGIDAGSYTSVLVSTLANEQGFALHVGGGPKYPILDRMGNPQASIFFSTSLEQTPDNQALVGSCVGTATIAIPGGESIQVFSRSCLQLGEWNYMAATWDGANLRVFLNGLEETDTLRMLGRNLVPKPLDVTPLYVGKMGDGAGPRHFNGDMDFIRVTDGAMKAQEILDRYKAMPASQDDGFDCRGSVTPIGALVQGGCDVAFAKVQLGDRDSMEVQFSETWDFQAVYLSYKIPVKFFRYTDHDGRGGLKPGVRTYWRTRVVTYVAIQHPTRVLAWDGKGSVRQKQFGNSGAPSLYRLDGSRIPANINLVAGSWVLEPVHSERGVILMRGGNNAGAISTE